MILSDLEETLSRQLGEAEARALAYEQALREIERHCIGADVLLSPSVRGIEAIARAALDKPGTQAENSANEVEKRETALPIKTRTYIAYPVDEP